MAPVYSPPTDSPCSARNTTSRIGAQMPACAKVGNSAMPPLARPIVDTPSSSMRLRP